jgi:hypothetical protein
MTFYRIQQADRDAADLVIVELVGYRSDEQDEDHEAGAILVCPARIVSVTPISDDIVNRIYA